MDGDDQLAWRTRPVANAPVEELGGRVVRLEVLDDRPSAGQAVLADVEFVVEPEQKGAGQPADSVGGASGGDGASRSHKPNHKGKTATPPGKGAAPRRSPRRPAFTALELLAATALTGLLLATVLHVIGTLNRGRAARDGRLDAGLWKADLLETLRRDLGGSTAIRYEPGRVVLTGHAALDRATMRPADEPVTVTYDVVTVRGRGWLRRRQASRDGLSAAPAWSELICPDVIAFALSAPPGSPPPAAPVAGEAGQPVPSAVVVQLDGPGGRLIDEDTGGALTSGPTVREG